jgi:hypothetical protein
MTDRVEKGMALSDEALAALCAGEPTELATVDEIFCGLLWACELVNGRPACRPVDARRRRAHATEQRRRRLLPRPLRRGSALRISGRSPRSPRGESASPAGSATRAPACIRHWKGLRGRSRLIGAGLSDREIADRLYITRKTVETHVGNLLAKLGLRNRAEAAAFVTRSKFSR